MNENKENTIVENTPFFPLGIIVLPGETRFLHIFEKKYKNLFEDLEKFDNKFGIPFIQKGNITTMGSYVKLEKVLAKYPNGEVDIAVKGVDIFDTLEYNDEHEHREYPFGSLELLGRDKVHVSTSLLNAFSKYNKLVLKLDMDKLPKPGFYLITNSIGLNDNEKYDLVIRGSGEALNRTMTNHINLRTLLALQQNSLQDYYCLN
ncbi:MAG: LON peptidase substrate-binding domain-containing protein [Ignavibacteria bacterium]|nr:LON peptidase substrate-binding domain-containing protein [Ignavibacteria bacterium]